MGGLSGEYEHLLPANDGWECHGTDSELIPEEVPGEFQELKGITDKGCGRECIDAPPASSLSRSFLWIRDEVKGCRR